MRSRLVTNYGALSHNGRGFAPEAIRSNTFPLEWPKGSGKIQHYPEIDDARWVTEQEARLKLVKGQLPILDALLKDLSQP